MFCMKNWIDVNCLRQFSHRRSNDGDIRVDDDGAHWNMNCRSRNKMNQRTYLRVTLIMSCLRWIEENPNASGVDKFVEYAHMRLTFCLEPHSFICPSAIYWPKVLPSARRGEDVRAINLVTLKRSGRNNNFIFLRFVLSSSLFLFGILKR